MKLSMTLIPRKWYRPAYILLEGKISKHKDFDKIIRAIDNVKSDPRFLKIFLDKTDIKKL